MNEHPAFAKLNLKKENLCLFSSCLCIDSECSLRFKRILFFFDYFKK